MRKAFATSTMMVGASLSLLLLGACQQGGGGAAPEPGTPEAAFQFRQAVMRIAANKMATIGGMAREEVPLDEALFAKSVSDLVAMAGMMTEGFMLQGAPTGSRALPEVWTNWADFEQKASALAQAAERLDQAVRTGGFAAAQELVQDAAGTCGGCHRTYRARTEE